MSRTNDVSERYIGLGNLNNYTFDFKVSGDVTDLLIIKTDADNNVIFKVRGDDTEYIDSITFADGNVGGTVTLVDDLETDYLLTIRLLPEAPEQDDQYRNQSDFSLKKLENSFDQQNGYIQAIWDLLKRVPRIPDQFLESDMDPDLLGEINDGLILDTDETVYLSLTKTATGFKFGTSAGTTEGLTAVEADVTTLQSDVATLQSDVAGLPTTDSGICTTFEITGRTTPGTQTYSDRAMKWTKIGDVVHLNVYVVVASHTGTGYIDIPLPYRMSLGDMGVWGVPILYGTMKPGAANRGIQVTMSATGSGKCTLAQYALSSGSGAYNLGNIVVNMEDQDSTFSFGFYVTYQNDDNVLLVTPD